MMKPSLIFILFLLINAFKIHGAPMENEMLQISDATIYVDKEHRKDLVKVVQVLQEEVQKRSGILWDTSKKLDKGDKWQVVIVLEKYLPDNLQKELDQLDNIETEGYQLSVIPNEKKIIVYSVGRRGALFGVGKLLRKMEIRKGEISVPKDMKLASSPEYSIRGHQLGYRPKTNSYDAWTVAQYDLYIRELAIFGANSIEIMPPDTDDDETSIHMKLPAIDMIKEQSRICDDYDLDVWMWYPNLGEDYTDPEFAKKELADRELVFSTVQRLDHLFVPGGDPGDVEPDVLFTWMDKVAVLLNKYHPDAKIWISPQVFRPTKEWLDKFYNHINEKPEWLGGVVFGPWIKTPLDEMRKIVDSDIPIRRYPDITHSLSSQYAIPRWDLAQAITLGRECINPRPTDEKMIHNTLDQYADGSLSYSEGTNDDLNKFVWSDQDWNPEIEVIETLREYARFFISPDFEEDLAQGFMAEERNVQGPLLINEHVQENLLQWRQIEQRATPEMKNNFRFQMGLIRAYFDAYVQKRLVYETLLEQQAKEQLGNYKKTSVDASIAACKKTLAKAWEERIDQQYKVRCDELADDLFASIGAQLTIEKHGAMGGRGNFIDNIDNPLNDVAWIYSTLAKAEKAATEKVKVTLIEEVLQRNNPGPGGFYDNFGNPASWSKVQFNYDLDKDPGNLRTPRVSFGVGLKDKEWVHEITAKGFEGEAAPVSWMNQVTAFYDQPLSIKYDNLNPDEKYKIKVAYTGRFRSRMKMMADGAQIHDFIKTGVQPIYEFSIPQEISKDGSVTFTWTCGEAERGAQVSEIWIIKE